MDPSEAGILVETREAALVKFDGSGQPIQRKGWFLKPNESIEERNLGVPFFPVFQRPGPNWVSKLDAKVSFKGWPNPTADWKQWAAKLTPIYKDVWKQAKIFDAIQVSTCRFRKDLVSIWEVLPYWSNETNTFAFPFGEASITLEDTMVLGGFSPIGFCVREVGLDKELYKLKSQLLSHHLAFNKTTAKKKSSSMTNHGQLGGTK
ncbi:uncharacterized protein A4U43_UnF1280 [Asparagus officinalis]|uniref:Aminotransferase-like plant mobile domain-containing protein n=1 Tax=Asparagus officinalis TaxID=4686 RepID=A0A1R3L7K4_ASPOF|nr:uncharacterized protein A4U43_UnF1280 [Asparagus officinalis]